MKSREAFSAVSDEDSPPPDHEEDQNEVAKVDDGVEPVSTPFNLSLIFLFYFFDSICSLGVMSIGLLVYIPWGLSLIAYANAYLIAFSLSVFTQVIVAFYSDKIVTPIGRRKPFVILSNALRYIAFLCLAHPPPAMQSADGLAGWFTAFYSLYMVSNAIGTNPFASWLIECTKDQADYTRIYSVAVPLGGVMGGLLGLGLLEVDPSAAAILAAVGGAFFTFLLLFFIPSRVFRESPRVPDMIPSIRICSQSAEFRRIFGVTVLFNAAMGVTGTSQLFLYYTAFDIKHLAFINELLLASALVAGTVGMSLNIGCNWLLHRMDKIKVFMGVTLWVALLAVGNFFSTFAEADGLYASFFFASGIAVAYAPVLLISQLFLRDLVVFDTFCTGCNRENMYLTAMTVPASILSNFIGGVPTVALSLSGFHGHSAAASVDDDLVAHKYVWTPLSIWLVRLFACIGVSLLVLQCYRLLADYALTTSIVDQLQAVNKQREAEKELEHRRDALEAYNAHIEMVNIPTHTQTHTDAHAETLSDAHSETHTDVSTLATSEEVDKQLLMHFSAEEVSFIVDEHASSTFPDVRQRLAHVLNLVFHGVCSAIVALIFLVTALIFDGRRLNGLFSTLLIYCVLLTAFYVFFEGSRFRAGAQLLLWSAERLGVRAHAVKEEYAASRRDTLHELLQRRGIASGNSSAYESLAAQENDKDVSNPLHGEKEKQRKPSKEQHEHVDGEEIEGGKTTEDKGEEEQAGESLLQSTETTPQQLLEKEYSRVSLIFVCLGLLSVFVIMLAGIKP